MDGGSIHDAGVIRTKTRYKIPLNFSISWFASLKIASDAEYFNAKLNFPRKTIKIRQTFENYFNWFNISFALLLTCIEDTIAIVK